MASTSSPQTEETFPYPLGVNMADSVPLRLCATNYFAWKQLMLRFLESHKLSGFVDGTINLRKKPPPLWESSLLLEERWEEEQETREKKRQQDWNQQHMQQEGKTQSLVDWVQERERKQKRREGEWEEESLEEQERWQEWLRRKEWGRECERRRERMLERKEEERKEREEHRIYRGWKKSDDLVRGWILATMIEELLPQVMNLVTARGVWIKLGKILTPTFQPSHLKLYDFTYQNRGQIQRQHRVLHRAILTADWVTTAKLLDRNPPNSVLEPITWCLETALIVAIRSVKQYDFMEALMGWIDGIQSMFSIVEQGHLLEQKDISGATALHAAVDRGNIYAVNWLVSKNRELIYIGDKYGTLPVHVAAGRGNRLMVNFLMGFSQDRFGNSTSDQKLLHSLASSRLYDIALRVLQGNPELASMEPSPLVIMAQKRTSFLSGTSLGLLGRLIYCVIPLKLEDIANQPQRSNIDSIGEPVVSSLIFVAGMQKLKGPFWAVVEKLVPPIKSVWKTKVLHIEALSLVKWLCHYVEETDSPNVAEILTEPLRNATCVGIHEIVEEILESFPSAIHLKSEKDQSLFHLAIVYRRENVFNLIYQMKEDRRAFLSVPDASTNNALHLAGNLTPKQHLLLRASAAGAALQMQRELQWFEEVGKWMLPQAKEHMNAEGKTPQEVFTETHKDLVKEGERWMKDTANSCTFVAALITTIVFAAAITVPGGSLSDSDSDKKGLPIRLGGRAFTVFGVSDALAMFSSSASLLMFLSILSCRYGEEDFRYSLPRRLIIGLVTLFLSIISMMVAFGATLKIVFGEKTTWLLYPVHPSPCLRCGNFRYSML